jgi:hypothetical protein
MSGENTANQPTTQLLSADESSGKPPTGPEGKRQSSRQRGFFSQVKTASQLAEQRTKFLIFSVEEGDEETH